MRSYGDTDEHPFIGKSITYFVMVIVGASTALTVLSPALVELFFADAYIEAATIAPILALAGTFQGLYFIYVTGLFYYKANLLVPVITLVGGAVNVGLNLLWIPEHGLVGAAWATLIGYLILFVGVRWACRRHTRLPFEVGRLAKLFGVSGALIALGVGIQGTFSAGVELGFGLALLGGGFAMLFLLRFWAPEEIDWMRRVILRRKPVSPQPRP
jgi:O-antigen/teichoic acid export membrane protein